MSRPEPSPVPPRDAFYEWLLSDAPAAREERARRRSSNAAHDQRERAQVTVWCDRTLGNDAAPPRLRDLAVAMRGVVARQAARDLAAPTISDDERMRHERRRYETSRHVAGDCDYRYPARYLGPDAGSQPVPPPTRPSGEPPGALEVLRTTAQEDATVEAHRRVVQAVAAAWRDIDDGAELSR